LLQQLHLSRLSSRRARHLHLHKTYSTKTLPIYLRGHSHLVNYWTVTGIAKTEFKASHTVQSMQPPLQDTHLSLSSNSLCVIATNTRWFRAQALVSKTQCVIATRKGGTLVMLPNLICDRTCNASTLPRPSILSALKSMRTAERANPRGHSHFCT
jgi:hypothetical protein